MQMEFFANSFKALHGYGYSFLLIRYRQALQFHSEILFYVNRVIMITAKCGTKDYNKCGNV